MDVDKKIVDMISHVSKKDRAALMKMLKMLDIERTEPTLKLILAIFKDIYMFRELTQAYLMRYRSKINELETRIDELEESKKGK